MTNISYTSLHHFLLFKTSIKVKGKNRTNDLHCATSRFDIVRNRLIVVTAHLKSKKKCYIVKLGFAGLYIILLYKAFLLNVNTIFILRVIYI